MAKDFKNNPALQFITMEEPAEAEEEQEKLTTPAGRQKAPEGYKLNPEYIEKKSKRVQLVLQPSLYNRVKAKAKKSKLSLNEYVHQVLDQATKE